MMIGHVDMSSRDPNKHRVCSRLRISDMKSDVQLHGKRPRTTPGPSSQAGVQSDLNLKEISTLRTELRSRVHTYTDTGVTLKSSPLRRRWSQPSLGKVKLVNFASEGKEIFR